jgi:hypothetical protein
MSKENVFLDGRKKRDKRSDLTIFKDNVPEISVDLDAACPRCLAVEVSKPGANDGESNCIAQLIVNAFTDNFVSRYNIPVW